MHIRRLGLRQESFDDASNADGLGPAKEGPGEGSDPEADSGAKSEAQGAGGRSAQEETVEQ